MGGLTLAFLALACVDKAPPAAWPEPPPPTLAKPIEAPKTQSEAPPEPVPSLDAAVNSPEDGATAIDEAAPTPSETPGETPGPATPEPAPKTSAD